MREETWGWLIDELLINVFEHLPPRDLALAGGVNRHWYRLSRDEHLWKEKFSEDNILWDIIEPKVESTFFDEYLWFKTMFPKRVSQVIDDYGYSLRYVAFSTQGTYFAVCGDSSNICVYLTSPVVEFLDERNLNEALKWKSADAIEFCQDESKFLVNGMRHDGKREMAVFSINPTTYEVHYICRIVCSPDDFYGCWYDNNYVISGEYYEFTNRTALGTSISQLWMCRVPSSRFALSETTVCPFLRLLNRGGHACKPVVSQRVSSRFRRVLQMSEEAKWEGKTLADKLTEVKMGAQISLEDDKKGLEGLKQLLDLPSDCSVCYLKHTLTEEEYGGSIACHCVCHHESDRLLIYVSGEFCQRVCFKLITPEFVRDVLNMKQLSNDENEDAQDQTDEYTTSVEFIMRRVHQPDHYMTFGGIIHGTHLSSDSRSLSVALESVIEDDEGNVIGTQFEQPRIDLEKMIVDSRPVYGRHSKEPLAVSEHLVAGITQDEVFIWSRDYGGPSIQKLEHHGRVAKIALHPCEPMLLSCVGSELLVWKP